MKRELKEYPEFPCYMYVEDIGKSIVIADMGGDKGGIIFIRQDYKDNESDFLNGDYYVVATRDKATPIPKPEYIPYTYEDFAEFINCLVKKKDETRITKVCILDPDRLFLDSEGMPYTYKGALNNLEILNSDGTTRPFGKLKGSE